MFNMFARAVVGFLVLATPVTLPQAAEAATCGNMKYMKDGQCLDARNKPGSHWTKRMLDSNFCVGVPHCMMPGAQ
jgi:hypothetical protein